MVLAAIGVWIAAHWVSVVIGTVIVSAGLAIAKDAIPIIQNAITSHIATTIPTIENVQEQVDVTVDSQEQELFLGYIHDMVGDFTSDLSTYYRFILQDPVRWSRVLQRFVQSNVVVREFIPSAMLLDLLMESRLKVGWVDDLLPVKAYHDQQRMNDERSANHSFIVHNRNQYVSGLLRCQFMEEGEGG